MVVYVVEDIEEGKGFRVASLVFVLAEGGCVVRVSVSLDCATDNPLSVACLVPVFGA